VLDDEVEILKLLRAVLTSEGHSVATAGDGVRGVAAFEELQPDLVITDIVMPEQEGMETILKIRRLDQRVPILAISGNTGCTSGDYLDVANTLGADRTLAKPFSPSQLVKIVDEMLLWARLQE
jgi:DNA-binding response OmpR family regulator